MSTKPVPQATSIQKAVTIPHSGRAMGQYILAARGTGKSTLAGMIAFQDYLRHIPQVIIDPLGATIDGFLFRILSFIESLLKDVPEALYADYWKSYLQYFCQRVRYFDVSAASGFALGLPLYYRRTEDSLLDVAERYLEVIRQSNPSLLQAQVYGWPPLHRVGVYTGLAIAAMGLQIPQALDLLRNPSAWQERLTKAQAQYPELTEAVAFFRDYSRMRQASRERLTNAFMDKIFVFSLDEKLKAIFGAPKPGIDWEEVEAKQQTVLLDFRNLRDPQRRFALLWVFNYLYEHIKARGRRSNPLGLVVDEFAALTQKVTAGENPLATLLDEFINQYMRQHNIWLTVAHQDIFQLDEQLQNTLLSLGTYVFGRASTMAAARLLADSLMFTDPKKIKHNRKVWGRNDPPPPGYSGSRYDPLLPLYFVLDYEPEFYPLEEQLELAAQRIKTQKSWEFLLRPALGEGDVSSAVIPINIRRAVLDKDTGQYVFPDREVLSRLRGLLATQSGIPLAQLLKEQERRLHVPAPVHHGAAAAQVAALAQGTPSANAPARTIHRRRRLR